MKRISVLFVAMALVALAAGTAGAGTRRIDHRQVRQHVRIHQGIRSGQLTRFEAARLRAGQRHVNRMERRVSADGFVNGRERRRVEFAQDRQSRRIYRLKHNARGRC